MKTIVLRLFVMCLLTMPLLGCGSKRPAGMPKLVSCTLTIAYTDGTPVADAIVMLHPTEGSWYANGLTNASGAVSPLTLGEFSGVAPGEYVVTVAKQEVIYPPGYNPADENQPEPKVVQHIDGPFGNKLKSPLKLSVSAGASVVEKFEVSNPKA